MIVPAWKTWVVRCCLILSHYLVFHVVTSYTAGFPDCWVWRCPSELDVLDFSASITASFDEQCRVLFHHMNLGCLCPEIVNLAVNSCIWFDITATLMSWVADIFIIVSSVMSEGGVQSAFSLSELVNLTVCLVLLLVSQPFWRVLRVETSSGLYGIGRLCCSSGGCEMLILILISQPALMSATTPTVVVFLCKFPGGFSC